MRPRACLACVVGLSGCIATAGPLPQGTDPRPVGTSAGRESELLVPPGHGVLRQDEITLTLFAEDLELKVTPLEEWVIRLTAPDTWARLSSLATAHREEVVRRTGEPAALFLVSFFSRLPGTPFQPNDVQLVNRGRRRRPVLIRPVTAGWGAQRLDQEEPQLAVYAYPADIDLEQPLALEYGFETGSEWEAILRRLESERSRARARAGVRD